MCLPSDEMPSYQIQLKNGQIPIYRKGEGERLLIVLHGFESNGKKFASWEETLGESYTICSPDLPFHGESEWSKPSFDRKDIIELILAIAKQEQKENFTLGGFSMGGRLVICTAPELKDNIEQLILLAPAGIGNYDSVPALYKQHIVEFLLRWPIWFKLGTLLFYKFRWISHFQKRYAEVQIFPKDKRYRLFRVFNSIIDFGTSSIDLVDFWETTKLPTLIILATRDRVVSNGKIKDYFVRHLNSQIVEIDTKHDLETKETAMVIHETLLKTSHHI